MYQDPPPAYGQSSQSHPVSSVKRKTLSQDLGQGWTRFTAPAQWVLTVFTLSTPAEGLRLYVGGCELWSYQSEEEIYTVSSSLGFDPTAIPLCLSRDHSGNNVISGLPCFYSGAVVMDVYSSSEISGEFLFQERPDTVMSSVLQGYSLMTIPYISPSQKPVVRESLQNHSPFDRRTLWCEWERADPGIHPHLVFDLLTDDIQGPSLWIPMEQNILFIQPQSEDPMRRHQLGKEPERRYFPDMMRVSPQYFATLLSLRVDTR